MISSCKRRSCAACSTKPGGRSISSGYFLNYQRSPTIRSRKDDSGGQGDFFLYNTYLIKEQRRGIIFFDRSCPALKTTPHQRARLRFLFVCNIGNGVHVTQTANYSGTFELLIAGSNPAIAFSGLDLPVFGNRSSHVCDIHSKTITVRTCQTRCGINDFIVARTAINW